MSAFWLETGRIRSEIPFQYVGEKGESVHRLGIVNELFNDLKINNNDLAYSIEEKIFTEPENVEIKKNLEQKAKDDKSKIKLILAKKIKTKKYYIYDFFKY